MQHRDANYYSQIKNNRHFVTVVTGFTTTKLLKTFFDILNLSHDFEFKGTESRGF